MTSSPSSRYGDAFERDFFEPEPDDSPDAGGWEAGTHLKTTGAVVKAHGRTQDAARAALEVLTRERPH
ncbi:hypothetical protein ACXR2U_00875 [Jatrophihabitans sp. YIM 134969]